MQALVHAQGNHLRRYTRSSVWRSATSGRACKRLAITLVVVGIVWHLSSLAWWLTFHIGSVIAFDASYGSFRILINWDRGGGYPTLWLPIELHARTDAPLSLSWWRWDVDYCPEEVELVVPIWCLSVVGVLMAVFSPRSRTRSHGDESACAACGYCLVGNTSGRCPECGTSTDTTASRRPSSVHHSPENNAKD